MFSIQSILKVQVIYLDYSKWLYTPIYTGTNSSIKVYQQYLKLILIHCISSLIVNTDLYFHIYTIVLIAIDIL